MTFTKEMLADWIYSEWSDDYFAHDDIQAEFEVLDFVRTGNSVEVRCRFVADETKKGNDSESLVLFRYDPENYEDFFPREVQIVTLKIKFSWGDSAGCDALSSGYEEETLSVDVDSVTWDDPRLSDAAVETLLQNCDQRAIAETLVGLHSARIEMPRFVPARLRSHFSGFIAKLGSH